MSFNCGTAVAKDTTNAYKKVFMSEAKVMLREAKLLDGEGRESLLLDAEKLAMFADSLPEPFSRRESVVNSIVAGVRQRDQELSR